MDRSQSAVTFVGKTRKKKLSQSDTVQVTQLSHAHFPVFVLVLLTWSCILTWILKMETSRGQFLVKKVVI